MSASMKQPASASLLNSVVLKPAKASIRINSQENRAESDPATEALSLFFQVLAEVGMSDKEAAYEMALDPAQLSRIKSGQARLPFDAMWRLPDHFWTIFSSRLNEAKHLTEVNRRTTNIARIAELLRLLIEEAA